MPNDRANPVQLSRTSKPLSDMHPNPQIRSRLRRAFVLILHFLVGHGALISLNLFAELFLVRKLSVESYAQFGIAYGFQTTVRILMDLGFASTIIPLVGARHDDRAVVGKYVRSAKHLRDRTFLLIAPLASVAFLLIIHRDHWSYRTQFLLLTSVVLALYSSGPVSYYAAPLLLYGRLRDYYVPQTTAAFVRILAYFCLRLAGVLDAVAAAGLNALGVLVSGKLLATRARRWMIWPDHEDSEADREIVHYVLPATPAIVFSAFQLQIALFLISIFGQTANIAEVAALGRIGQLFTVLMTFNVVIVEPYVARLARAHLFAGYVRLLALTFAACAVLVVTAFRLPGAFVWILGPKYSDLRSVVGWAVLAGSINHIAGLIWVMNRARKWLFWSGSWLEVILVLAVQIWFIAYVGVRTTWHAVLLSFVSSFCYLIAHGYVSICGFLKGPRAYPGQAPFGNPGPLPP